MLNAKVLAKMLCIKAVLKENKLFYLALHPKNVATLVCI